MACKDQPHIYYKKQYLALYRQNVERGSPEYFFTGGKGIEGCLKHLNNINTVCGGIHIMVYFICKTLGIKPYVYRNTPEEGSNLGLLSLLGNKPSESSSENPLEKKIDNLSDKIRDLRSSTSGTDLKIQLDKLRDKIDDLERKVSSLNTEEILKLLKRLDDKV
nr:ORF II protein [Strawberry vein banding virus]